MNTKINMKKAVFKKQVVEYDESVLYWMNKYIALLEKFNQLLLENSTEDLLNEEYIKLKH